MIQQRTLRTSINAKGIGLHSGVPVMMKLRPAPVNTGIIIIRTDLQDKPHIHATATNVCETVMCTKLGASGDTGVTVATVEHLLSAFAGLGIDNAYVDVNAGEIPIMDGSSSQFVFLIQSAGIQEQQENRTFVRILKEIKIDQGDRWVSLKPFEGFLLKFSIGFDHPFFANKILSQVFNFSSTSYLRECMRSRTFGFQKDIDYLKSKKLAMGGSEKNAIVIGDKGVINPKGLRRNNELIMHKILDAIGDLYLLGHFIIGKFEGFKSGHALNNLLLRKLLETPDSWEFYQPPPNTAMPSYFAKTEETE